MEKQKKIIAILTLDLSAAFHLIDKEILINKLNVLGGGNNAQNWIDS